MKVRKFLKVRRFLKVRKFWKVRMSESFWRSEGRKVFEGQKVLKVRRGLESFTYRQAHWCCTLTVQVYRCDLCVFGWWYHWYQLGVIACIIVMHCLNPVYAIMCIGLFSSTVSSSGQLVYIPSSSLVYLACAPPSTPSAAWIIQDGSPTAAVFSYRQASFKWQLVHKLPVPNEQQQIAHNSTIVTIHYWTHVCARFIIIEKWNTKPLL